MLLFPIYIVKLNATNSVSCKSIMDNSWLKENRALIENIVEGRWTGYVRAGLFSRPTKVEILLWKEKGNFIGNSIINGRKELVEASVNSEGNLIISGRNSNAKNNNDECSRDMILEFELQYDDFTIELKGNTYSHRCIRYSVELKREIYKAEKYMKEVLNHISISKIEIIDKDKNGIIEYNEPNFNRILINNPTPFKLDNIILATYGVTGNEKILFRRQIAWLHKSRVSERIISSMIWFPVEEEKLKIIYEIGHKDYFLKIGEHAININKKKFSKPLTFEFKKSNLVGTWKYKKEFLTLKEDNTFEFTYEGKKIKYGKWQVISTYYDTPDEGESMSNNLLFYNVNSLTPSTSSSFLKDFNQDIYYINQGSSVSKEKLELNKDRLKGGFEIREYFFLENSPKDDLLIQELNKFITGKWRTEDSFLKLNLAANHRAVKHNPINQSSEGDWYWTYTKEKSVIKCYLWLSLGKVYGVQKYELLVAQTTNNNIKLRAITGKDKNNTFNIIRDPNLIVPEDIMDKRIDEIARDIIIGSAIEHGWKETDISEILGNVSIRNGTDNIYSKILDKIRLLNK